MKRSLGFRLYFEMKEKGVGGAIKKYRYLKAGLEIVGDHKMALEARKVF